MSNVPIEYVSPTATIVLIIFMLWRDGLLSFKKNDGRAGLGGKMDRLVDYYNHETTQILSDIRDGVRDANLKLDDMRSRGIKSNGH